MSFGLALTLALLAVSAQSRPKPLEDASSTEATRQKSAQMLQSFADCTVARRGRSASLHALLRSASDTSYDNLSPKVAQADCMRNSSIRTEMSMPRTVLQASLYDALYRARFKRAATDFSAVAPLDIDSEFDSPPSASDRYLRLVGDCIARRAGPQSQQLLLTRSGSEAEVSAFEAIKSHLPDCVPEGNKLAFSKTMLRGIIAEAMLKLTTAAAALPKSTN